MTDIVERLRDAAISLIDGNAEDIGDKVVILDNAAFEIEKLRAELERLRNVAQSASRGPLESVSWWLEGCLNCKTWHWDGLQREAAEQALNEARAALALSSAQCATNSTQKD